MALKNLPTDLLRAFVTVAELGGITQAGELLGRTQPAVSLQIRRLEKLVDRTLLNRSGQRFELTSSGHQLYRYAKQILALNDEALAQFAKTGVSGKIRFGIPSEFATTLLPRILGRFAQAYPNVTLEVTCSLSVQLLANSADYDLILALHDDPGAAGKSLLKTEELVWVSSESEAQQQASLPLIAAPEGCIYRKRATKKLNSCGRDWRIVYTIPDLTGIEAAIAEGLGVTVLARSTVPKSLKILKPSSRLPRLGMIGISLIENKAVGDAVSRLSEYVKTSLS